MEAEFRHDPVMLTEILEVFAEMNSGVFVDATLGGAGHSSAILDAHSQVSLLGIDRDEAALEAARHRLNRFGGRVTLRRARFDSIDQLAHQEGIDEIAGALFDLGVSSPQLDVAERGFSYRHDADLDMRMDRTQMLTASDVVNTYDEDRIAAILHDYADERFARRIAKSIVAARPLTRTVQLVEVITAAIPAAARRRGGHPAKRSFQAIRIEVNQELDILADALRATIALLAPGARLAVLSYHSGEDRIVKAVMRNAESGGCTCPSQLPCVCGRPRLVRRVRTAREASARESQQNPRARSARLRVVERLTKVAA